MNDGKRYITNSYTSTIAIPSLLGTIPNLSLDAAPKLRVVTMGSIPKDQPFGKRLLPQVIDKFAASEPDRHFIYVPKGEEARDGCRPYTFGEFANGINYMSSWLLAKVGTPEPGTFPTIAYVGPNDVRYLLLTMAVIKTGYKVRFAKQAKSGLSLT